jgi:hypothetical protein
MPPTANGVGSGQRPSGESPRRPDEAAAERTAVMTSVDRTALMARLAEEPDDAGVKSTGPKDTAPDNDPRAADPAPEAESVPVEATQVVSSHGHTPAEDSGADTTPEPADDDATRAEATQVAPASPARSG